MPIKVKKHTRTGKNGAAVVKAHTRKAVKFDPIFNPPKIRLNNLPKDSKALTYYDTLIAANVIPSTPRDLFRTDLYGNYIGV